MIPISAISLPLIIVTALSLVVLATPVVRRLALRMGVVDTPSARKIHLQPVPLLGGVAIYLGFIVALLFWGDLAFIREAIAIVVGASLVSLLGIWDDRWGVRPLVKLLGQALAAVVLLLAGVSVGLFPWEWLNWVVTVAWVVGITNAMNLLDNMDGLSGGVAAVAAAFFLLLAAGRPHPQFLVAALAAALLGACLGFLRYNFNPDSIFMGDAGSLFLGFMLAALAIKLRFPPPDFPAQALLVSWMIPLLVLAVPIFDTTLVVVSRLRRGLNPLTNPGKDHLSHRLVGLGMTRREAVLSIYVLAFGMGMIAVLLSSVILRAGSTTLSWGEIISGYGIGAAVLLGAILALVRLERGWKPPQPAVPEGGQDESVQPPQPQDTKHS